MEQSTITALFLPLALFIIMLGMGMTLSIKDFKNVIRFPKAFFLGLGNQLILLPAIGFSLAWIFNLPPELAVGLILISLCPGGPTSNIISFLAKADLALSVSLTAVSSFITNLTIPIFLNVALYIYMGGTESIQLPFGQTFLQILIVTVIPVLIGMGISDKFPEISRKSLPFVNKLSIAFFVIILLMAIFQERANIIPYFMKSGVPALMLNVTALLAGYFTGKMLNLNLAQNFSISIETGIQNGTLAIAIALSPYLLGNSAMAIPPAIYSLLMFLTAAVVIWLGRRKYKESGVRSQE